MGIFRWEVAGGVPLHKAYMRLVKEDSEVFQGYARLTGEKTTNLEILTTIYTRV